MVSFVSKKPPYFPPVETADSEGLLAVGGELTPQILIEAYSRGIFPWFNPGDPVLWWSPDPRLVLFPDELHVSKRLARIIRQNRFQVTFNRNFLEVILNCALVRLEKGQGTWIGPEIVDSYYTLHKMGFCLSVETWHQGKLVGGLYGVLIGKVFFGESMFSLMSNASKVALVKAVEHFKEKGVKLIDCQQETRHLKSMGARLICRKEFISLINKWCMGKHSFGKPRVGKE